MRRYLSASLSLILVLVVEAICSYTSRGAGPTAPTTQATTQPGTPDFVVGIWAQPASSIPKWIGRGINTFYGYDSGGNVSKKDWEALVTLNGAKFIDEIGEDILSESKQPGRIGFAQKDESDSIAHINLAGSRIEDLRANFLKAKSTGMPMWINLMGSAFDNIWYDGTPHPTKTDASKWGHRAATNGYMAQGDRVGFDYHLATTGRLGAFDITKRLMDRLNDWSGGKPIFVYAELCTQGTGNPYTADDYELEVNTIVDYARLKGYKLAGIIYFSDEVYPNWKSYDITPADIVDRMTKINARLTGRPTTQPSPPPLPIPPVPTPPTNEQRLTDLERRTKALEDARDAVLRSLSVPTDK